MLTQWFSLRTRLVREQFNRRLFLPLFGLALTVSLVFGSVGLVYSQAGIPSAEEVRGEIRALAKGDVQNNRGRRTQSAIDWYRDNPAGVTAPEIRKTYDDEYDKQVEIKQRDPKEAFKEWLNLDRGVLVILIFLAGGALGAVLRDTFTQWVTGFFKAIDDWVYARYAGSPWFRNVALGRYRTALVNKYKDLPIPFRTNRPPLGMSEVYVSLKVEGSSGRDQVDAYAAIAQHRHLMVKGPPGSGKSMLLKHMALSYGKGRLLGSSEQPVPILLELHRLNDPALTQDMLIQALVDAFARNDFPRAGRFVQQSLEQGTLMLLLDGLDEVNSEVRPVVVRQIKDLVDRCDRCRVVMTCRTAVYRGEFNSITQQTLEVVEFSDQQIRRFLGAWEREMPPEKSVDQLIQTLRDRPRIFECLADAQAVDEAVADAIINEFKAQLGVTGQHDILSRAFGAVAAGARPRGQAVFEFLQATLADPQAAERHPAIASALSMTNLPQAAQVLAHYYTTLPVVREPLLRMGDLAVPELASLAHQHQATLEDLFAIGTPDAAIALVPILWWTESPFSSTAAWYLAGLLPQAGVEEALQESSLETLGYIREQERLWKPFEWIWQPFAVSPNSTLTMITGRIAHELAYGNISEIPNSLPSIAPRLVIPLCAIETVEQLTFPINWDLVAAEALLTPSNPTPELDQARLALINRALGERNQQTRWRLLLSGLPPKLQLGLLDCLMNAQRRPTQNDWRHIFRSVKVTTQAVIGEIEHSQKTEQ
jgi:hypothetical protein